MLLVTYDGEIWYPSLYDLDTSWGTSFTGTELFNYAETLVDFQDISLLARRLEYLFPQELHDRYFELREDILTKEHVLSLFNTFNDRIPNELKTREAERWGDQIPGYDLTQIEEYLDVTAERLDEKYANLIN